MVHGVLVCLESECIRDMILLPSVLGMLYTPAILTEWFYFSRNTQIFCLGFETFILSL